MERAAAGASAPDCCQLVAVARDGRLVGTVRVAEFDGTPNVLGMWVDPEHRSRGVGGALLDEILRWAVAAFPGREFRLEVNPRQSAAVALYQSRGFRASGASRPLGHTEGETRFEMRRAPT